MHGRFWKIATLLSFILIAVVVCFGFKAMSNISAGKDMSTGLPPAIVNYGRKAMDLAKPVLDKLGIVGDVRPTEIVKEKLQAAGAAVNEATRNFTQ
ncbi:MAG: hypothetical protein IJP42_11820 [Selenomonadaceae bacterium]|nr:hypothetical protein [Selenomonadaceae bacterium]